MGAASPAPKTRSKRARGYSAGREPSTTVTAIMQKKAANITQASSGIKAGKRTQTQEITGQGILTAAPPQQ